MALDIEGFRRLLHAVLLDPARADQLVEAVAQIAASGQDALQEAMTAELERAIVEESSAQKPFGRSPKGPTRIDILMLSPGGVVLKGRYFGKSVLASRLNCVVDEGHVLGVLSDERFAKRFASVRDGLSDTAWFEFEQGQAGFAAVHTEARETANERPDSLLAIFVMPAEPDDSRLDAPPKVTPLALEHLCRRTNPAIAKPPREWMNATPDRRIFQLRDGRRMSTRWYGATDATPVLYFGVTHMSTTANALLANAAIEHGLALVVLERPGMGASDPDPNVSYESVARDAAEIRRALDLSEVLIYGAGTAANFALAAAHRLGDAAKAVALVSPRIGKPSAQAPSSFGRVLWSLLKRPAGLTVLARVLRQLRIAGSVHSLVQSFAVTCPRDRAILKEDGLLDYLAMQTNDAVHFSVEGALTEFRLLRSGARFDPALVRQPVYVWHGAQNRTMLLSDMERAFSVSSNVLIDLVADAGVLMNNDDARNVMRWLSGGWRAQIVKAKKSVD